MIVIDASVVVDYLLGPGSPAGDTFAAVLDSGEPIGAPHLLDAEVGQVLRRYSLRGDLTDDEAGAALDDYLGTPITKYPHPPVLARAFEFRSNVTVYDGLYLALAEALDCRLLTGDRALAAVPSCRAAVEVLPTTA